MALFPFKAPFRQPSTPQEHARNWLELEAVNLLQASPAAGYVRGINAISGPGIPIIGAAGAMDNTNIVTTSKGMSNGMTWTDGSGFTVPRDSMYLVSVEVVFSFGALGTPRSYQVGLNATGFDERVLPVTSGTIRVGWTQVLESVALVSPFVSPSTAGNYGYSTLFVQIVELVTPYPPVV